MSSIARRRRGSNSAIGECESRRVCRRLRSLRRWSHDKDLMAFFPGGSGARHPSGAGARGGVAVVMVGDPVDRLEDRLHGGDAAGLRAA